MGQIVRTDKGGGLSLRYKKINYNCRIGGLKIQKKFSDYTVIHINITLDPTKFSLDSTFTQYVCTVDTPLRLIYNMFDKKDMSQECKCHLPVCCSIGTASEKK